MGPNESAYPWPLQHLEALSYQVLFSPPHGDVIDPVGHGHGAVLELLAPLAVGKILKRDGAVDNLVHLEKVAITM